MRTTPGPWIVNSHGIIEVHKIDNEHGNRKCIAICDVSDIPNEEAFANAALISIAPDMLEALIAIQEAAQMDMLDAESIEKMISDVFAKLANEAGA